jgi:anti-anti-sigma factor
MVEIHLLGVPVDIWIRASAHQDALQREFEILAASDPAQELPRALLELVEDLTGRFHQQRDESRAHLLAAAERGAPHADITIELPKDAARAVRDLGEMLEAADDFCREGDRLLTQVTPPELLRFRAWFLGEVLAQLEEGRSPRKWELTERASQGDAEPATHEGSPLDGGEVLGDHRIEFSEDLDISTAGALHDQIVTARSQDGFGGLIVDLSGVGFMDSVGISLLVSAYRRVSDDGTPIRLILPARLKRLLEISGLIETLKPEFVADSHSGT